MEGVYVSIRVRAGAKKESISEIAPGRFEIAVRERAERNQANRRVVALIAAHFRVREKDVRMVKGQRSPVKLFTIGSK